MEKLTYSRMRMYLNCPASEQLRYSACLVPRMKGSTPRLLGSAVHKGLETGSTDEAMALFDSVVPVSQEEQDQMMRTGQPAGPCFLGQKRPSAHWKKCSLK